MADEKVNMGPEENKPPETLSPPGQGDLPPLEENNAPAVSGEDKTAPDHVEPDPPSADKHTQQTVLPGMGEDTPAPSGKVINLSDIQAADKDGKEASTTAPEKKAPEAEQPKKRRGRPPKEQAALSAGKKEKAAEPRTGRPSKVDKAAREEAPPSVRDKVSRGKKADKGKERGSGGAPASKPAQVVKPGKAAPIKEAAVPPPEINLPPTPDVPPRPVEEGKIVYLKMAELHPFHTFREHPYKVQDDKAMDDLVGTIKEHGIMTPATVRPEKDGKGYEIIAGHRRHHGGTRAGLEEMPCSLIIFCLFKFGMIKADFFTVLCYVVPVGIFVAALIVVKKLGLNIMVGSPYMAITYFFPLLALVVGLLTAVATVTVYHKKQF